MQHVLHLGERAIRAYGQRLSSLSIGPSVLSGRAVDGNMSGRELGGGKSCPDFKAMRGRVQWPLGTLAFS